MASKQYFQFIGSVWDFLPGEDKDRLSELWQGYEQIFASAYQANTENDLNISLNNLQSYSTERWLSYEFLPADKILLPPIYTSTQDLSVGVNLSSKYLLKFRIDGGAPFEVNVQGLAPNSTSITEVVAKINAITFPRFPHVYRVPYERVVSIPRLQTHIRDESDGLTILEEGTDYAIEQDVFVSFKVEPPELLWAKRTMVDDETPWNNFGFLMGIYQKNTPSYLQVIQGLWYAFWTGPKPKNLQIALYLLFGLPVAPEDGTVTRLTSTEIDVTTTLDGVTTTFPIPTELVSVVTLGQSVTKYDPLVNGIEIFDKIGKPGFIDEDIGRAGIQRFLLDEASRGPGDTDETKALRLLEEHTFLPQISVEAFVSPDINLGNVKTFLESIKPLSKTFLFQVIVGNFRDPIVFGESLGMDITIDVTPNLDSNQTTFDEQTNLDDYETIDSPERNLDSEGACLQELVEIEVYSFGSLIDSFVA